MKPFIRKSSALQHSRIFDFMHVCVLCVCAFACQHTSETACACECVLCSFAAILHPFLWQCVYVCIAWVCTAYLCKSLCHFYLGITDNIRSNPEEKMSDIVPGPFSRLVRRIATWLTFWVPASRSRNYSIFELQQPYFINICFTFWFAISSYIRVKVIQLWSWKYKSFPMGACLFACTFVD